MFWAPGRMGIWNIAPPSVRQTHAAHRLTDELHGVVAPDASHALNCWTLSDRDKDIEILALRHQLLVLQRHVGEPAFTDTDRAILAARIHQQRQQTLRACVDAALRLPTQLAMDLLAWMPMPALTGKTCRWEPKKLRLRLFSAAAQLMTTGRRRYLRLAAHWPWTDVINAAADRLHTLPNPG
ncbi:transposase [Streptomyces sp. NPDC051217]|uniref:transposase n=1 Tax=Streptomyces sp. NPDC051217 TaxID=3365644 RepID=UPI0037A2BF77